MPLKTVKNKSVSSRTKTSGEDAHATKGLASVAEAVSKIEMPDIEMRASYEDAIKDAETKIETAVEAKENATTENEYLEAVTVERRAADTKAFYESKLDSIRNVARISEDEYTGILDAVKAEVDNAVKSYIEVAESIYKAALDARTSLLDLCSDADRILRDLDARSNFLQLKHAYSKKTFVGRDPVFIPDPNEWIKHAVRYDQGKPIALALEAARQCGIDPDAVRRVWLAAREKD